MPFRTVAGVVDKDGDANADLLNLYAELPLIQVSGLGIGPFSGQTGCPVFKRDDNAFLGLIGLIKGSFQFLFPVSLLKHVLKFLIRNKKNKFNYVRFDGRGKDHGPPSGGYSKKRKKGIKEGFRGSATLVERKGAVVCQKEGLRTNGVLPRDIQLPKVLGASSRDLVLLDAPFSGTGMSLTDVNSSVNPRKRKGSVVWNHMGQIKKKVGDKDVLEDAICNYCNKRLAAASGGNGTSTILRHLQKHCPKAPLDAKKLGKGQQLLSVDTMGTRNNFKNIVQKLHYDATLRLSAFRNPTSHVVLEEMVTIQVAIRNSMNDQDNHALRRVATSMLSKFEKYWGSFEKVNALFLIGNVLDSRRKMVYQKILFEQTKIPKDRVGEITLKVKEMMRFYEACKILELVASPTTLSEQIEEGNLGQSVESDTRATMRAAYLQQQEAEKNIQINNEVDAYLCDPCEGGNNPSSSLLLWWKVNASKYPTLMKVARDVLAMPCSTVASENAFSLGERTVIPFRASLTPKMVEALVCTHDWIKAEEFNLFKEPTKEEEDFYKECEEIVDGDIEG